MTERTYVIGLNTYNSIIEYFQIMLSFKPYVILHVKRLVEMAAKANKLKYSIATPKTNSKQNHVILARALISVRHFHVEVAFTGKHW